MSAETILIKRRITSAREWLEELIEEFQQVEDKPALTPDDARTYRAAVAIQQLRARCEDGEL
ncbi:hypothetical protein [Brevibacterium moorei]|uniref:hypothetical protein n=1 Tax=Brevibacterium moorei TaxID=2968457 RepID=UPI00211C12B2|nr:hypothetical protein [Brevibacterium sp. 68QC2CO]MCQ9384413.1 hypothetical protein [Brevibacterium sp. 68QC2CO]